MDEQAKIVMEAVRAADHDRYLSALYAPEDKREALFSLYAFNAEIAGVRDRIREALPGEVRLQWWRDVIASEDMEAGAGHPLAQALLKTISAHNLPKAAFDNYIEARIFDLYDDPMPSRTDLEGYCGETASAILQLSALVLDPVDAPRFSELAGHAGCAQGIAGILLLLPLHRARGQCYIPAEILTAAGISSEEFLAGDGDPAAGRVVEAMVALGREHLAIFENGAGSLPATLRPAFLPLALSDVYLAKMAGPAQTLAGSGVRISLLRKHWLLFSRAARGWS